MKPYIKHWPKSERPREKLMAKGAATLSDAELLAIFLGSGVTGQDAVSTSRDLLASHNSLRELLDLEPKLLQRQAGMGLARAARLLAALELGQRYLASHLQRGAMLGDPYSAGRYFTQRLRGYGHEVFAVMFLDTRHRTLGFEELFRGTLDCTEVHPREVVRRALSYNAAAVIVGHNHPSGCTEPSSADRAITLKLKEALALVDVRLLDHFVVGDGPPVSMAMLGWV
jgi:DNA repair protein RadC